MVEERLPGGYVTEVARVGDTVRRRPGPRAAFVHELLRHFERCGWPGAPRFLGIDEQGREVLDHLEGHVPWRSPSGSAGSVESLVAVARLLRRCHDLTAGTPLAGDHEVVCHNDLSPRNTVYRETGEGLRPVAFLDWDLAAPGARIHDVAHLCWQYLDLGPAVTDLAATAGRMRAVGEAYGLADRSGLVATILWWQERCAHGIEAAASAGEPAMVRLRDSGAADAVRAAHDWVVMHRAELESAMG